MKHRLVELGEENIIGAKVFAIRTQRNMKQKALLAQLHLFGLDISPTILSRIEGQHRAVRDYEVAIFARALKITPNELLDESYMPSE